MIPPKGTTNRRVIDFLRPVSHRTRNAIYIAINDISKAAIDMVIDSEVKKGNIRINKSGIRLTASAERELDEEGKNADIELSGNFRPRGVQPSWKDRVARPGAAEFMNWPSKQL